MDVVPSLSFANLLNQRHAIRERLERIQSELGEIEALLGQARLGSLNHLIEGNDYQRRNPLIFDMTAVLRRLEAQAWDRLFQDSGLRTFMDATARTHWDHAIKRLEVPAFTPDNVKATFAQLHATRGEMFERGVVACFQRLSWDFKTNQPVKFGPRVILRHLLTWGGSCVATDTASEVDDLVRALHVLDGRPEPDHRQGIFQRLHERSLQHDMTPLEDDYVRLRWYKNGNGHLTFKRPDLVERLNAILAKHFPNALPARPAR